MIDLVFVLTNKLEIQVKDVRKTVTENQENNQIKIDEMANAHTHNLEIRDRQIGEIQRKLETFEKALNLLKNDQEDLNSRADYFEGRLNYQVVVKLQYSVLDKSKEQKDELDKLWLLKVPIDQTGTDVRNLKDQLGAISTLSESQNQSLKKSLERSIEENVTTIREEMGNHGQSLKEFMINESQRLTKTVVDNSEVSSTSLQNIKSEFDLMTASFHSVSEELTQLKDRENCLLKDTDLIHRKFENFQDLNSANINNLKLQIKNQESLVSIKDTDIRNLVANLDNKLSQKVFTEDTKKKIDLKFSELELSNSNVRKENENIITKFNDFKVDIDN